MVLDVALYKQEALRQLQNPQYYQLLPVPLYPETAQEITAVVYRMRNQGYISKKQLAYLTPNQSTMRSRYFYLLPKIHKARSSWPHPDMPAGRPIVSDCETESSRICEFIDYYLQPLSTLHPSYLKDTYHFISKIRDTPIDPSWLLISADVESLYTNMKIDIILSTITEIFNEFPDPSRPDSCILELLALTLKNNDFEFDGNFYLQVCGIAMGRRYAPSAANIYLRKFDYQAMNGFYIKPLLYSRFLDDIFGIWPGTRAQLSEYQSFLNTLIPGIKVTFTVRDEIIEFLDTEVYKYHSPEGDCLLKTKVYFKPTDTHQLLHRRSFHPHHTFTGIVKSQFIRFKRISSSTADFQQACSTLIKTLRTRGYTTSLLTRLKKHVWHNYEGKPSAVKNSQDEEKQSEIIPVVTYYDNFHSRLNRRWAGLIRSNPVFSETRVLSAYKRHKNLKDFLVKGRFGPPTNLHDDDADIEERLERLIDLVIKNQ